MEINTKIFEEIGLTKSEIKVYLALLKLGPSTKKAIVNESQITPSKVYEVTDRLSRKGLVSSVKKNRVLSFSAAPPEELLDLLDKRKKEIEKQKEELIGMVSKLKSLHKAEEPNIEVYSGWQGMQTVYKIILREMKSGEIDYVFGATLGEDQKKVIKFFEKFHKERRKKGIIQKIIINKKDKAVALKILNNRRFDKIKFIENHSPSEVNIWQDNVMIVLLTKIPVVTLIKSKVTADSFKSYFNELWKIAK